MNAMEAAGNQHNAYDCYWDLARRYDKRITKINSFYPSRYRNYENLWDRLDLVSVSSQSRLKFETVSKIKVLRKRRKKKHFLKMKKLYLCTGTQILRGKKVTNYSIK